MASNGQADNMQDVADDIQRELRELQRQLRGRANEVRKEVVKQLYTGADAIRREARQSDAGDDAKRSADEIARGLEKAASYLNSRSVEDMGEEAVRVVRANPVRAVIVAFVVGLLMGVMMRGDK
ncbi:MAG: hypothetical protein HZC41_11920 [Chloroflexi bacterium]|nr:hypothetical protein [Chloroflexota bacterium]